MRLCIVFFGSNHRNQMLKISEGLAKGLEAKGHFIDIIDGEHDVNKRLSMYSYIVLGAVAEGGFGGKINEKISTYLSNAGVVSGKRSFAFILKKGLRLTKTLQRLMAVMEHEGMFIKYSDILSTPEEAEEVGKRLHIQ